MTSSDRELKILLKLQADVAGAQQVRTELAAIQAEAAKPVTSIQAQLAAAGVQFDPISKGFKSVKTEAEGVAAATGLWNVNTSKARQEALVFFREVAAGNIRASTLSSLLGSMGTAFTIAGIAAYELYHVLDDAAHESLRISEENRKQTLELQKQTAEWQRLANAAGDFADVLKLEGKIEPALDKAAQKLEEFRVKELSAFQLLWDAVGSIGQMTPGNAPGSYGSANEKQIAAQLAALQNLIREGTAWKETARQAADAFEKLKLEPLNSAIAKQSALVDEAKGKYAALAKEAHNLAVTLMPGDEAGTARALQVSKELEAAGATWELQKKHLNELTGSEDKLGASAEKLTEQIKQADFKNLDPDDRLAAYATQIDTIHAQLKDLGVDAASPLEALAKRNQLDAEDQKELTVILQLWARLLGLIAQTNQEKENDTSKALNKQINADLREQAALLQSIRQQQQLIEQNPFISADAKAALLLNLYLKEEARLLLEIAKIRADIALVEAAGDEPEKVAQLNEKLQHTNFVLDGLKLKIATLNQPLTAELANWVNSFGTSAHQIAGFIEGSINAALQSTNQLLIDAAFRTGDWKQTVVGLEKSVLNMFLTMLEQMALQQAASLLGITTTTTAQTASGAAIAAAHAPAAAATSISSYGTAALIGEVLAIAAIVAIMAALGGGFARGGRTGSGPRLTTVGEEGEEFVFNARATRNIGIERLYAAQHAAEHAPHFDEGGWVEPGPLPGTGGDPWRNPIYGPQPYWGAPKTGYPYMGDWAVSPHLFKPGSNPFAPGGGNYSHFVLDPETGQYVDVGAAAGYNPSYPGGSAFAVDPHTGLWTRIDPSYPGSHPASITINAGAGGAAIGHAEFKGFDPSGEPIYGDAQGDYYNEGGEPLPDPGPGGIHGYPSPGYTGPGSNFAGTPIPGYSIIGHDTQTGAPIYKRVSDGRLFVLPGTGTVVDPSYIGYGQSPGSAQALKDMASAAMFGNANRSLVDDEERVMNSAMGSHQRGPSAARFQAGAPTLRADPSSAAAYNAYVMGNWAHIPGHAVGGLMPGPPSTTDTMLGWFAGNEYVLKSPAVEHTKRIFGPNFLEDLNDMRIPMPRAHFAGGGAVGSSSSASSASGRGSEKPMKIVVVANIKEAIKEAQRDSDYTAMIVNAVNNARHELALPPVNG